MRRTRTEAQRQQVRDVPRAPTRSTAIPQRFKAFVRRSIIWAKLQKAIVAV